MFDKLFINIDNDNRICLLCKGTFLFILFMLIYTYIQYKYTYIELYTMLQYKYCIFTYHIIDNCFFYYKTLVFQILHFHENAKNIMLKFSNQENFSVIIFFKYKFYFMHICHRRISVFMNTQYIICYVLLKILLHILLKQIFCRSKINVRMVEKV